eukprot:262643_1
MFNSTPTLNTTTLLYSALIFVSYWSRSYSSCLTASQITFEREHCASERATLSDNITIDFDLKLNSYTKPDLALDIMHIANDHEIQIDYEIQSNGFGNFRFWLFRRKFVSNTQFSDNDAGVFAHHSITVTPTNITWKIDNEPILETEHFGLLPRDNLLLCFPATYSYVPNGMIQNFIFKSPMNDEECSTLSFPANSENDDDDGVESYPVGLCGVKYTNVVRTNASAIKRQTELKRRSLMNKLIMKN